MKAVVFVTEHQRLSRASKLYTQARAVRGVVDAFPTLGRFDGVIFLEAPSMDELNEAVVRVSRLPGVWATELHAEGPLRPARRRAR